MSSQNLTGGETPPRHLCPETVGGVLYHLARHPGELLIRRWNWKSALLSSLIRGLIFFFTNLVAGLQAAIGAMLLEAVYRALTAGFYGSMTQAFRHARPAWLASLTAMVLLPVVSHVLEYFIHWVNGTPRLMRSILASAALTVLSTLFNLHAMRRGALVVGHQQQSLAADMRRMPMMVATFAAAGPLALWRLGRRLTTTRRAAVPMGGEAGEKTCAD